MVQFNAAEESAVGRDPLAAELDGLRQACDTIIADLKKTYGWRDSDLRIQAIHRLRNVMQSVLAVVIFHRVVFPSENFWRTFFVAVPSSAHFTDHYRECDVLLRFAALHGQFSAFESDVRAIVNALDSSACAGGTAEFDGVVRWLLARVKSAAVFGDFLELVRLTRNTIHNNGIHRPKSGKDATLTCGGKTYAFRVGQPVDFVDWDFVVFVGRELLSFLRTIVSDPVVAALPMV